MPAEAAIPWRIRPDLVVVQTDTSGSESWTVKDPLRLKYFHLQPEEMTLLQSLNGRTSWRQILDAMQTAFPGSRFSIENLHGFLLALVRNGLAVSTQSGHAELLLERDRRSRTLRKWGRLASALSHRFRGIDPTPILKALDRLFGWLYSIPAFVAMAVLVAGTCFVAITQADEIGRRLPQISQLATLDNLTSLFIAVVVIKIIHELGHGLTCYHHGGECHELGVILVGFVPMLYCDVSDTWLEKSRWKRIQVSAAGIVVELVIASVCFLLWRASIPGALNLFLLNLMLVASVNTVLINGNPLLRYDGYHVLTDLLRMPNLGTEARRLAGAWFDRLVLGIALPPDCTPLTLAGVGLILYGVASSFYRFFVLGVILWAMHQFLKPHGLESLVVLLLIPVVVGMAVSAALGNVNRIRKLRRSRAAGATSRAAFGFAVFVIAVLLLLLVPLPHSVQAPFTIVPNGVPVYVTVEGRLESAIKRGTQVQAGQPIARLANADLARRLVELESEHEERQLRLQALRGLRSVVPTASAAIPAAQAAVASAHERLETMRLSIKQLEIVSPVAGRVVSRRNVPRPILSDVGQRFWHGNSLDDDNLAAWLNRETLLCWIEQESSVRADAMVKQEDVALILNDALVELHFLSDPLAEVSARVVSIGSAPGTEIARELVASQLVVATVENGVYVPLETRYVVRISADTPDAASTAPLYSSGVARIACHSMSLAARLWRACAHAFAFRL